MSTRVVNYSLAAALLSNSRASC